ncbi:MAG: Rpn family recombination-promoting nuclease/putative transposase [Treponema sp.]|nr:Rpn family recombination-promoting nuclease/putative transposase [Treponema sp.]
MIKQTFSPEESWQKATLANRFLFYKIFTHYPDMCKKLLELLLHIEIDKIEPPEGEKSFEIDFDSKGIRLDIYTKTDGQVFDVELQAVDTKELPQRARYYQSLMDIDNLQRGHTYSELPDSYVLFICMEDIFGEGLPVYAFENICAEDNSIKLGDGTQKIFFNVKSYAKIQNEEERKFFEFLYGGKAQTDFTKNLDRLVTQAKHNAQWRHQYMTWEQEAHLKYLEGAQQQALEIAENMLKENISPEIIARCTGLPLSRILEQQRQPAETVSG